MDDSEALAVLRRHTGDRDYGASATVQSLTDLAPLAADLAERRHRIDTLLDLGCGYGGLTAAFADLLDCEEVYGIDLDAERREVAEDRGVTTFDLDLGSDSFPLDDSEVDLVLSFGVLEHLQYYDPPVEESSRVLRNGGHVLFSVPNLGSWVNRVAVLLGKQPRDVEISKHRAFGISGFYPDHQFLNHVHSPTYDAFLEFLAYHGFDDENVVGLFPYQERRVVRLIDRLTAFRPQLCRRIAVLGTKRRPSPGVE